MNRRSVMRDKSIQVPKELFDKLKALGQKSNRTLSKEIAYLLDYFYVNETAQEYCEREPMRTRLLKALEGEGRIVDFNDLFHVEDKQIEDKQKRREKWKAIKEERKAKKKRRK